MAPEAASGMARPIFIVGSNGSGSTLLRLMLDSHERIAIPQETGFLRLALTQTFVPYWALGDQWSGNLGLSDEGLTHALAEFYGGLFASYAEARGKARWGDKTPFHVWHLQLATRMFPDCQIIGIVRHPGAVVSSQRRRFRRAYNRAANHWLRSYTELVHEAMALGDRCVILRYEDLVRDPAAVARPLLAWLDEPWSDAVLDHHEIQPLSGAPEEAEGFTRTNRPIDEVPVAEWERHLRGSQRRTILEPTARLAAFLGYDAYRTLPLGDFGDRGSPLVSGTELAERRATQGGDVDWSYRPPPPYADQPLRPPVPRRRRRRVATLDTVTIRDIVRHRLTTRLGGRLSDDARKRANDLRRDKPIVDRIIGPR
jgi:Sulfotransferase family